MALSNRGEHVNPASRVAVLLGSLRRVFPSNLYEWLLVAAGVALWAHVNLMFALSSGEEARLLAPGSNVVWLATLLGNVCALLPLIARSGSARLPKGDASRPNDALGTCRPLVCRPAWVVAACLLVLGGATLLLPVGNGRAPAGLLWLAVLPGGVGEGLTLVFFAELFCGLAPQKVLCIAGVQQILAVLPALVLVGVPHPTLLATIAALVVMQTGALLFLGRASESPEPAASDSSRTVGPFPWGDGRSWLQVLTWAALVAGLCYGATLALTLISSPDSQLPMSNMLGAIVGGTLLIASSLTFTHRRPEEYLYQVAVPLLALGLVSIPLLTGGIPAALPILLAFSTYLFGLLWFFAVMFGASAPERTGRVAALVFLCFFVGHLTGRALISFTPSELANAGAVSALLLFALVLLLVAYISARRKHERAIVARAEELDLTADCDAVARRYRLTPREQEVFRLLALGFSTRKIADKLVVSENSVNTHIRHIYAKLGIHGRNEVAEVLKQASGSNG